MTAKIATMINDLLDRKSVRCSYLEYMELVRIDFSTNTSLVLLGKWADRDKLYASLVNPKCLDYMSTL